MELWVGYRRKRRRKKEEREREIAFCEIVFALGDCYAWRLSN